MDNNSARSIWPTVRLRCLNRWFRGVCFRIPLIHQSSKMRNWIRCKLWMRIKFLKQWSRGNEWMNFCFLTKNSYSFRVLCSRNNYTSKDSTSRSMKSWNHQHRLSKKLWKRAKYQSHSGRPWTSLENSIITSAKSHRLTWWPLLFTICTLRRLKSKHCIKFRLLIK